MKMLNSDDVSFLEELFSSVTIPDVENFTSKKEVLSVKDWLNSKYHVGELKDNLFPFWKERTKEVFSDDSVNFSEIIVSGSLSSGKSFWALVCWLRLLYLFSLSDDLQNLLGLSPSSRIIMAYLSVSQKEAMLTGFGDFTNLVDSIPYFIKEFPRNKAKSSVLEFPNGVTVISGSDVLHFIGSNLISLIFDETNFVRNGSGSPGDIKKAFNIYISSRNRINTRFNNLNSSFAGLNILVSSASHKTSFMEQVIKMSDGVGTTKTIVARVFETKPKGSYSEKKFLFFLGNDIKSPQVMRNKFDFNGILPNEVIVSFPDCGEPPLSEDIANLWNLIPDSYKHFFIRVPIDFYNECLKSPDHVLLDVIGHSCAIKNAFFTSKSDFEACIDVNMKHPFHKECFTIGVKDVYKVFDYLDIETLKKTTQKYPCFIHIDQSVSGDSTGIACSHAEKIGDGYIIVVDFMIRIDPPGGNDKISISKCKNFIVDLINAGINVVHVSYDQYQSTNAIQDLNEIGIDAGNFSCDSSDAPWVQVSDLMFLKKIRMYAYPLFKEEWFELVHDKVKRKVDHPKTGSKDISDAFVASVFQSYQSISDNLEESIKTNRMDSIFAKLRNNKVSDRDVMISNLLKFQLAERK